MRNPWIQRAGELTIPKSMARPSVKTEPERQRFPERKREVSVWIFALKVPGWVGDGGGQLGG